MNTYTWIIIIRLIRFMLTILPNAHPQRKNDGKKYELKNTNECAKYYIFKILDLKLLVYINFDFWQIH